jgi:predicted ferric reductase
VLVLAHVAVLLVDDPGRISLFDPLDAPWRAQAAVAATVALLALTATSVWRMAFGLGYEDWRGVHIVLGAAVLGFGFAHVVGVHKYTSMESIWASSIALLGLGGWALAHLRLARPRRAAKMPYRLRGVRDEPGGATTLELEADGHDGMAFQPGQFAWLKLGDRPYALREHPFSYASSASHPEQPAFTVKAAGDFTSVVGDLEPGTPILVDGPHGSFMPMPDASYLLVAGGIGITPIMSILRTLADEGDDRHHALVYANRTLRDAVFRDELDDLADLLDLDVFHVLSDPPAGWTGETGRVDEGLLQAVLARLPGEPTAFVCGPPPLVDAVETALHSLGLSGPRVHTERFAAV